MTLLLNINLLQKMSKEFVQITSSSFHFFNLGPFFSEQIPELLIRFFQPA